MKICLYSPYIPKHVGGGEKYMFDVAQVLSKRHRVEIAVPSEYAGDQHVIDKYQQFLNRNLDNIAFMPSPLGTKAHILQKLFWTRQFDVLYYLTDGSLFFSLAKRNILHIQFPLRINKSSLIEKIKLRNWQIKNTNSEFTRQVVETSWPVKIDLVHQPMVEVQQIISQTQDQPKEKIILSVGRFFRQLHSKRQDVLIDIFRELKKTYPHKMKGWKLVLIGSIEDPNYLSHIKRKKRDLPVEFYHNISREELIKWYGRASIYWHGTGYGVNETRQPEKVEHFGISTVEAMAAGCIPLVVGKGGQKEVLGEELSEFQWQTKKECMAKTLAEIVNAHDRDQFRQRARQFGEARFEKLLWEMVEK